MRERFMGMRIGPEFQTTGGSGSTGTTDSSSKIIEDAYEILNDMETKTEEAIRGITEAETEVTKAVINISGTLTNPPQ